MALQPLVENAVRHAVGQSDDRVTIEIEARSEAGKLVLTVRDTGPGLRPGAVNGHGIGIANTRARLRSMHADAASLQVENRPHRGVEATIELPLVEQE